MEGSCVARARRRRFRRVGREVDVTSAVPFERASVDRRSAPAVAPFAAAGAPAYWYLSDEEAAAPHDFPVRVFFTSEAARQLRSWPLDEGVERAGGMFGTERHGVVMVERVELADKFRQRYSCSLDTSKPWRSV